MVKLQYTYRGEPITPYRPQRSKGPGKVATVIIVALLVCGLLYGAGKLYSAITAEEDQNNTPIHSSTAAQHAQKTPVHTGPQNVPVNNQPHKITPVNNREVPREMIELDREIRELMNQRRYEEARQKLQVYLRSYSSAHAYFAIAQDKLAECSDHLKNSGTGTQHTTHTVVSGDNLSKIAKKYKVSIASIEKASKLKNRNSLKIGQKLIIPIPAKWKGIVYRNRTCLYVYQENKLIRVYTLSRVPKTNNSFLFDHNNRAFWISCGLSNKDWNSLKSLIPAKAEMQISIQ